jgi:outer membrane lipoprotein carrier protein
MTTEIPLKFAGCPILAAHFAARVGDHNSLPASRRLKGTGSSVKAMGFSVKGTGFSPYMNPIKSFRALAPEGCFSRFLRATTLFLLATSLSTCLHAQVNSINAHNLAQNVDRHYNQLHSLQAGFTESYEGLGIRRTESGTLFMLQPGRMKWQYSSPPGKLFLLDGKYAWFYTSGDPQVQRIPAKKLDDLRSPLRFLLGHTQLEKELNNLKATAAPNGRFILTGRPKGQENRVSRLSLTVTADGTITAIEVEETDGALTRFTFTGEQSNAPVSPGAFHFTPPAGVPVVDALPPV